MLKTIPKTQRAWNYPRYLSQIPENTHLGLSKVNKKLISTALQMHPQRCDTFKMNYHKTQWMDGKRRKTNLSNKGLTSADRSNKATLLLTVPRPIQVVYKGFTPTYILVTIRRQTIPAFPLRWSSLPDVVYRPCGLILTLVITCGTNIIVSSTDSDLEAFSHNPTDDSFGPLPAQAGPNTNYPNERFLSY